MTRPALALAAGGARGAYQAGALLGLAEAGLRFEMVGGTSVGALNGAYLAQGDGSPGHAETLCAHWRALPDAGLVQLRPHVAGLGALAGALACVAPGVVAASALARLGTAPPAVLDPTPLARVLDAWLDYGRVLAAPVNLVISVLPAVHPALDLLGGAWRRARHLEARTLTARDLRAALLAASAIPLAFPARRVGTRLHADAGLADPLPARALYDRGARTIVSVFLSDSTPQDRADFPGATLLQVRPSRAGGDGLASTFDFSRAAIERAIDAGHRDSRAQLAETSALAEERARLRARGDTNEALASRLPRRRRAPAAGT